MKQIKNYSFKKKAPVGKYRTLMEHFLDSKEKLMTWECTDVVEYNRVIAGFTTVISKRKLQSIVRVRQCREDLVVGLERVDYGE